MIDKTRGRSRKCHEPCFCLRNTSSPPREIVERARIRVVYTSKSISNVNIVIKLRNMNFVWNIDVQFDLVSLLYIHTNDLFYFIFIQMILITILRAGGDDKLFSSSLVCSANISVG